MEPPSRTVLVTLTGRDRPGVTSRVLAALDGLVDAVVDVEQVVIRGRLVLGLLLATDGSEQLLPRVLAVADELQLEVDASDGCGDSTPRAAGRSHVTVLARPLRPLALAGLAGAIAGCGANIDRIVRLAADPVTCLELEVSGVSSDELRVALAAEAVARGIDVAVQPAGLQRRAKRLIVMDVDSTLIQDEVVELIAGHAGVGGQVRTITAAAMRGELDFEQSLRARVALLEGLDAAVLDEVRAAVRLTPGARTLVRTLKRLDYRFAVVSGGFTAITDHLVAELGIDFSAANVLEVVDGRLTGQLVGPVVDRAGKAAALERFAELAGVPLGQTVAVGDGANDIDMITRAGLGIAFNAKQVVREAADASVSAPYLDSVLYLLGISREEVEDADAADARG